MGNSEGVAAVVTLRAIFSFEYVPMSELCVISSDLSGHDLVLVIQFSLSWFTLTVYP